MKDYYTRALKSAFIFHTLINISCEELLMARVKALQRLAFIPEFAPHREVVMWHSSKAFYTETTYSPRSE